MDSSTPDRPTRRDDDVLVGLALCALLAISPVLDLPATGWTGRRDAPVPAPVSPLRLDPNVCRRGELQILPRVGPSLAARIDAERRRFPFRDPSDLLRVHGIGPATLAGIRPYLRFGPSR